MKINSTKFATCFQLSGFNSNDFKPSDQYPRHLALKKLSQVTNCIKPNDFKPNGIKPSDHLTSIRSLQFDQKLRPLSFRPEKFDLFTATPTNPVNR